MVTGEFNVTGQSCNSIDIPSGGGEGVEIPLVTQATETEFKHQEPLCVSKWGLKGFASNDLHVLTEILRRKVNGFKTNGIFILNFVF